MAFEERDGAYLWDMLEYAKHCVAILANRSERDWHRDLAAKLAIERSLEIIGEAARRVSATFGNSILKFRGAMSSANGISWRTIMVRSIMIDCTKPQPKIFRR